MAIDAQYRRLLESGTPRSRAVYIAARYAANAIWKEPPMTDEELGALLRTFQTVEAVQAYDQVINAEWAARLFENISLHPLLLEIENILEFCAFHYLLIREAEALSFTLNFFALKRPKQPKQPLNLRDFVSAIQRLYPESRLFGDADVTDGDMVKLDPLAQNPNLPEYYRCDIETRLQRFKARITALRDWLKVRRLSIPAHTRLLRSYETQVSSRLILPAMIRDDSLKEGGEIGQLLRDLPDLYRALPVDPYVVGDKAYDEAIRNLHSLAGTKR